MSDSAEAAIATGLAAWTRGDLDALLEVLDPRVTLTAVEHGPWDCGNRDEVMALLRLRESQRRPDQDRRQVRVVRRDDAMFLMSALGGREGSATVVTAA